METDEDTQMLTSASTHVHIHVYTFTHTHISYTLLHTHTQSVLHCFVSSMRWELSLAFPWVSACCNSGFKRLLATKLSWCPCQNLIYKRRSAFRLTVRTGNGFSIYFICLLFSLTPKPCSLCLDLCDITAALEMESHKSLTFIPLAIQSALPVFHINVWCVAHARGCVGSHQCAGMRRPEQDIDWLPLSLSAFLHWEQFSLSQKPFWLDWLVSKLQRFACLHSHPSVGLTAQGSHAQLFTWAL